MTRRLNLGNDGDPPEFSARRGERASRKLSEKLGYDKSIVVNDVQFVRGVGDPKGRTYADIGNRSRTGFHDPAQDIAQDIARALDPTRASGAGKVLLAPPKDTPGPRVKIPARVLGVSGESVRFLLRPNSTYSHTRRTVRHVPRALILNRDALAAAKVGDLVDVILDRKIAARSRML